MDSAKFVQRFESLNERYNAALLRYAGATNFQKEQMAKDIVPMYLELKDLLARKRETEEGLPDIDKEPIAAALKRENIVQITVRELPQCDWQTGNRAIKCPPGRVVVEMAEAETQRGVLHLTDEFAANMRPDIGTVIAVGDGVDLEPGEVVLVRGYDGTWRRSFVSGDYQPSGELRFYGVYCGSYGEPQVSPWYESIVATMDSNMSVHPKGIWVKVKRDPCKEQTDGGVLLHADHEYRSNIGTVLEVGEWVGTVAVGDRIVYHPMGMLDLDMGAIDGDKDLCLMPEGSIEAILVPDSELALAG